MTAAQLMEFYKSDRKLSKFLPIIRDSPLYPVIFDSKNTVLSLPPIINGEHSKITLNTKNVFIECTATDITKAHVVLNTIVTMFSQYCKEKFKVEPVEIIYQDVDSKLNTDFVKKLTKESSSTFGVYQTPNLSLRDVTAGVEYINKTIGINESPERLVQYYIFNHRLVSKMSLGATLSSDSKSILVKVPPTRSDILHACDVVEDAAIAYNFNKIKQTTPQLSTIAVQLPINKLADIMRREIAFAGFTEVLAFTLVNFS
jgi:phenylalanyl-tRNA synthetase beta chain